MMESTNKSTSSSANDDGEEWLQVNNNVNSHSKLSTFAANNDEELQSLSSHTDGGSKRKNKNKFQSLELGHEDNHSYSSDDSESSNSDEEYELTDNNQYEPTISDHISGNTSSLVSTIIWRTKEKIRCRILLLLATLLIIILIVYTKQGDGISLLKSSNDNDKKSHPPGAVGVGHASYDAIESTYLYEYKAQLSLYRHRTSGAEFLTFVPDKSGSEGSFGSSSKGGSGYDPKPDKVFGIAFRTKPESSTGVPHILERE